jgi:hypothetical protein
MTAKIAVTRATRLVKVFALISSNSSVSGSSTSDMTGSFLLQVLNLRTILLTSFAALSQLPVSHGIFLVIEGVFMVIFLKMEALYGEE